MIECMHETFINACRRRGGVPLRMTAAAIPAALVLLGLLALSNLPPNPLRRLASVSSQVMVSIISGHTSQREAPSQL